MELCDFTVDFLRSRQLKSLEDQGMSHLISFCDLINELQSPQAADEEEAEMVSETEPVVVAPVMKKTVPTPVVADQVTGLVNLSDFS